MFFRECVEQRSKANVANDFLVTSDLHGFGADFSSDFATRLTRPGLLSARRRWKNPSASPTTHPAPILVVVFTCNHCPIAQMYEQRIQQLEADYHDRGVAVVAIQPNDPKALRIDELDSSDISDTLDEMKIRCRLQTSPLSLSLRRRNAIRRPRLRPASHASRLHLRQGSKAPLRRPHRQQLSQGIGEHAGRPQCDRRAAGQPRSTREKHRCLRLLHQVARKGSVSHRSRSERSTSNR